VTIIVGILGEETTRQDVQTKIEIPQNQPVIIGFSGYVGLKKLTPAQWCVRMTSVFMGASYILCADVNRFIRMLDMQSVFIGIGIHSDSFDPEFPAGAHNSNGDLTAVCDQYLFEHIHSKFWMK
jgi:hypothetical protein